MQKNVLAHNRRATFDYHIQERFEAGLVLLGSEVKALRCHKGNLGGAFIEEKNGELFLKNVHIASYENASYFSHDAVRDRKILVHKKQCRRLIGQVTRKGITLIPLSLYLNPRGLIKMEVGLAAGRKKEDKRELLKERQWKRDQERLLRTKVDRE